MEAETEVLRPLLHGLPDSSRAARNWRLIAHPVFRPGDAVDLEEAFSSVEHLVSRYRLLIGRGYRPEQGEPPDIDWGAGDVRDIRKLRGLAFMSEIGPTLLEIHDDYVAGTSRTVTSITWSATAVTFIILGAESPEQIAETLCAGADELVSRHVKGYLSERFSDWKQPLAKVLPFRGRNRE